MTKPGRVYDTARWQRVRARQLARETLCRVCAELDRETPATEVDHIKPLARDGAPYDRANLQSLCTPHHSFKTNNYDAKGLEWSTHALRGCFSDGSPRDPAHPWYVGPPDDDTRGAFNHHGLNGDDRRAHLGRELVSKMRH